VSGAKRGDAGVDRSLADQADSLDNFSAQHGVDSVTNFGSHQGEFLTPDGIRNREHEFGALECKRCCLRRDPLTDGLFPCVHQPPDVARAPEAHMGQCFPEYRIDSVNHLNESRLEFFVGKASESRAKGLTIPYVVWQNRRPHKITGSSVESRFFGSEMRLLRFIHESEETPKPAL